ncbi:protein phosphatase 2C domain-containing protein [Longispora sp. NPDC051575]|uniref:protein phosphatase 2C domain-containing protein n=1 Tax=Longispora sp. NPDC051575 TaxID=3154943 RepID=UPI00344A31A0
MRELTSDAERWGDSGAFEPRTVGARLRAAEQPWRFPPSWGMSDTMLEAGRIGEVEVRAAATRGPSHRFYGEPRQDAVGVCPIGDRYLAVAVADGVGSAPKSGLGASTAVTEALRFLARALPDAPEAAGTLPGCFASAAEAVLYQGPEPAELSTTLTVAVLGLTPTTEGYAFHIAQLGDSPAYILSDGVFRHLFDASETAVHNAAVHSLPAHTQPDATVSGHLAAGEALVLATDGLGNPLGFTEVSEYLADAWRTPPGPIEFLYQLQFRRRTFDDDRSAVVLWATEAVEAL